MRVGTERRRPHPEPVEGCGAKNNADYGGTYALGNQTARLRRHRARIELSGSRTRLRPHAPRAGLRLSDPGRPLSDRGRHRLSRQCHHGIARHARAAVPREHDREPARQVRAEGRRHPLRDAHAPAYRPCRQGRSLPDEHHGGGQSPRDGAVGLGPDVPAISAARHQAPARPAAHQERHAADGSRDHRRGRDHSRASRSRRPAPIPKAR